MVQKSFGAHIAQRQKDVESLLELYDLPGLIIGAGEIEHYYEDDRRLPFQAYHHFAHWCPAGGEGHYVVVVPGQKPVLLYYQPTDFWYDVEPLGDEYWVGFFDLKLCATQTQVVELLKQYQNYGYLGPMQDVAQQAGLKPAVQEVSSYLNWQRCYKSSYEVTCLEKATDYACRGHHAAEVAFRDGGSEFDIHMAYLKEVQAVDEQLPYQAIVALNEKSGILHYQSKRLSPHSGDVLLIDSGFQWGGYAADITRTYVSKRVPEAFSSMLEELERAQLALCKMVEPGLDFGKLQLQTHRLIAEILLDHGVLRQTSVDEAFEQGLTKVFFPHGIGHMLGLLVHDVGGRQANPQGDPLPVSEEYGKLRSVRTVEPGFVFTVEPGIYFIPSLLAPYREQDDVRFDWQVVQELMPYGGMRIEDNLVVTNQGAKNLTRQYLP